MNEKVLQIGSGSMGTRRLRDLTSRSDVQVALFETREDRRTAAIERFGIRCFDSLDDALAWGPSSVVISTPPHTHPAYVEMALQHGLHVFSEAELFPYRFREVERMTAEKALVAAPSCTMFFLPVCMELKRIVAEELGALHAYSYCPSTRPAGTPPKAKSIMRAIAARTPPGRWSRSN